MAASPGASSGNGERPSNLAAEAGCIPCAPASEAPPIADSGRLSSSLCLVIHTSWSRKLGVAERVCCGAAHTQRSWRYSQRNHVTRLDHNVLAHRSTPPADRVSQEPKRGGSSYQRVGDGKRTGGVAAGDPEPQPLGAAHGVDDHIGKAPVLNLEDGRAFRPGPRCLVPAAAGTGSP